jgi:hypothetical protein
MIIPGEGEASHPETNLTIGTFAKGKDRKIGVPIRGIKDDPIIEVKAIFGCILSAVATTNGICHKKTLRTEEPNGCGRNMGTGNLDFNLFAINV